MKPCNLEDLAQRAGVVWSKPAPHFTNTNNPVDFPIDKNLPLRVFAGLIIKEIIHIVEWQQIPVGNSAAGEMAADWTLDALRECRNDIRDHFPDAVL